MARRGVLGLFALAACGRVGFDEASDPDGPLGPWGTPRVLPELHGDGSEEDPSVTADRLTIVWTSDRTGNVGSYDLFMASRPSVTEPFTNVERLTTLDTAGYDGSPEISPDGLTLYFSTDPGATSDFFVSTRPSRTAAWGAAVRRDDLSSPTGEDFELAISPDGRTAVITRDNQFFELSRSDPGAMFANLVAHPELDISNDVASPTIDDGGRVIYFHAGASRDIRVARRGAAGGTFSTPVLVPAINTADRDADPFISADETYMVYSCGDNLCEIERS